MTALDPTTLLAAGAARSAKALAARQVSAVDLCEAAIARIEALDGPLNAVVVRDFDRARRQAAEADAALARGERRPLLGVPMTVKEAFNVAGLPTSWGLPQYRHFVPRQDAVAVARLKAAGAVILGKTNVPPALADWQCDNPVYGRTVHPLDARRTPGGSSGGGAAAVATGMVALELGSDLTGSLRVPASFCGVYAHKPSEGLLPTRGFAFPGTEEAPAALPSVIGPIGHGADDLSLALDVLAGPDAAHVAQGRFMLPAARHSAAKDWRVLVVSAHPQAAVAADVRAAVEGAGQRLAKAGASVAQASDLLPDLAEVGDTYGQIVQTVLAHAEPGGRSPMRLRTWFDLLATRTRIRAQLRTLFMQFDAVLCPAAGCAAFEHVTEPDFEKRTLTIDGKPTRYDALAAWSGLASLGGLPATVAPVGFTAGGLPLGVQIVGPYFEDRSTLALAGLLGKSALR
ncbi:amidase [Variovorax paradoxus]|uniref:Amidase n=1 Tax=Variovorax paradoxus TaxID=34073 RepID=A0AAE3XVX0_VARPD|nr:amidase family protein [Variovorax paradoxus]MDP9966031.1 amidase [Variovorax paradoxus]MDR6425605.1 amidase [Variovorax paradoxus]